MGAYMVHNEKPNTCTYINVCIASDSKQTYKLNIICDCLSVIRLHIKIKIISLHDKLHCASKALHHLKDL